MKIERKSKISILFKDLKGGDIFIDYDGDVCMKTEFLLKDDANLRINAVTLNSGVLFFNEDDNFVWLPNSAKLIVEE